MGNYSSTATSYWNRQTSFVDVIAHVPRNEAIVNLRAKSLSACGLTSLANAGIGAVFSRSRTTARVSSACHSEAAFTNLPLLQMCVEDGKQP